MFVIDYQKYKNSNNFNEFERQLIFNLPKHIGKPWFFTDLDQYYDSRKSFNQESNKITDKVANESNGQIKTFADEFNENLNLTDSEEDSEENKNFKLIKSSHKKRERFKSEIVDWEPMNKRRLSYSKDIEELFIATFPVDCNIPKAGLDDLVEKGKIMDEDPEYVEFVFKRSKFYSKKSM